MKPLFVQIKCELGATFKVAEAIVDTIPEASEVYSTSGAFDLLVRFHLEDDRSVGHFVTETLHKIPSIKDTYTILAFRVFVPEQPDGLAAN